MFLYSSQKFHLSLIKRRPTSYHTHLLRGGTRCYPSPLRRLLNFATNKYFGLFPFPGFRRYRIYIIMRVAQCCHQNNEVDDPLQQQLRILYEDDISIAVFIIVVSAFSFCSLDYSELRFFQFPFQDEYKETFVCIV